jgi:CDP-diacylglycerol--glycerol-3-phosphate 3-phosphatidyltransferase
MQGSRAGMAHRKLERGAEGQPPREGEGRAPAAAPHVCFVPRSISEAVLRGLDRASDFLVARHVPANAVTSTCVALGALGGLLLAGGAFAIATVVLIAASLGDALDGMVARRGHTASSNGALLDASCDRYQEFFVLAGVAMAVRDSAFGLFAALFAILGSFMVSYGSAKAEALGVPVPKGAMRRPERAVIVCVGAAVTAITAVVADRAGLSRSVGMIPLMVAASAIAAFANGSAILRLRAIADALAEKAPPEESPRTPTMGLHCPSKARR